MAKKNEVKKAETVKPNSTFTATDISPRGVKAIFGGVRLNWTFVATPKQDAKNDKKAQYRTQAILGNGEKEFIAGLKKNMRTILTSCGYRVGR